jgi:hypothetical protein
MPEPEDLHPEAGKTGECEGEGDERKVRLKADPNAGFGKVRLKADTTDWFRTDAGR